MAKKVKRRQVKEKKALFMSIFIAVVMVTSVFGVVFYGFAGDSTTTQSYNNYRFKLTQQGYQAKVDGQQYVFSLLPQEVEIIPTDLGIKYTILDSQAVILTSDANSTYQQEIAVAKYNIFQSLGNKPVVNAYVNASESLPELSCDNATTTYPVIEFRESNDTRASLGNNGCIMVEFKSAFELQRVSTKIMYMLLGVIDEEN